MLPSSRWEPLSQLVHSFPISPAAPPTLPAVPAALTSTHGHHALFPAALRQQPPLPFSRVSSEAQTLLSAPAPPPVLSLLPSPWGILGGEGPADSLTPLPTRDSASESCGPGRNREVLGVCDSATPVVLHHPVYSPSSIHTQPLSGHRACIPTDPYPCRSKGAQLGQGRSLSSILSHYSPQTSPQGPGSWFSERQHYYLYLLPNFASPGDWELIESSGTLEFKVPGS